jgi:hypothetical protein
MQIHAPDLCRVTPVATNAAGCLRRATITAQHQLQHLSIAQGDRGFEVDREEMHRMDR